MKQEYQECDPDVIEKQGPKGNEFKAYETYELIRVRNKEGKFISHE